MVFKHISNFFAFISMFVLGVFVLLLANILITKNVISYDSIYNSVLDSNIFNCKECNSLSSDGDVALRDSITNDIERIGVKKNVVNEVIDSSDLNIVISNYIYDYVNNIMYKTGEAKFDVDKTVTIIEHKNIVKEGKKLNETQKYKLKNYINVLIGELNAKNVLSKYIDNNFNDFQTIILIYGSNAFLIYIIVCIVIISLIVLICLSNIFRFVKWSSIMLIIDGFIAIIGSLLEVSLFSMKIYSKSVINNLAVVFLEDNFKKSFIFGVIFIILGIVLFIVSKKLKARVCEQKTLENPVLSFEQIDENTDNGISDVSIGFEEENNMNSVEEANINEEVNDMTEDNDETENETSLDISDETIDDLEKENNKEEEIEDDTQLVEDVKDENELNNEELTKPEEIEMESIDIDYEEQDVPLDNTEYEEISDKEDSFDKKELDLKPLEEINLEVISPFKGKEIKPIFEDDEEINGKEKVVDEDDEEIEIL